VLNENKRINVHMYPRFVAWFAFMFVVNVIDMKHTHD